MGLYRPGDQVRQPRNRRFVPGVVDPAAALLRVDEAGPAKKAHVMGDRRLREADRRLDVAGAEPRLVSRDQVAAGAPPRFQQLENAKTRRVGQRLEGFDDVSVSLHTSKNLELKMARCQAAGQDDGSAGTATDSP